jgi:hypothetical protein
VLADSCQHRRSKLVIELTVRLSFEAGEWELLECTSTTRSAEAAAVSVFDGGGLVIDLSATFGAGACIRLVSGPTGKLRLVSASMNLDKFVIYQALGGYFFTAAQRTACLHTTAFNQA